MVSAEDTICFMCCIAPEVVAGMNDPYTKYNMEAKNYFHVNNCSGSDPLHQWCNRT